MRESSFETVFGCAPDGADAQSKVYARLGELAQGFETARQAMGQPEPSSAGVQAYIARVEQRNAAAAAFHDAIRLARQANLEILADRTTAYLPG